MQDDDIRRRLDELTARLDAIERRLGLHSHETGRGESMPTREPGASSQSSPQPPTVQPGIHDQPAARTESLAGRLQQSRTERSAAPQTTAFEEVRSAASAPSAQRGASSIARPSITGSEHSRRQSLEVIIGRYWFAWVGAIVVVIAVGLFFKLAYDRGWIGQISPLARCLLAAVFGGLLITCGEIAFRKINQHAAAGLHSAGIAVLYLTVYAALRLDLVAQPGALGLLAGVAILGFGITWRTVHVAIGVISVIGGYFSPLLLGEASTFPGALPLYLTMLYGVSLGLSAIHHRAFGVLRYVSMGGLGLIGLLWLLAATDVWQVILPLITLWWVLTIVEALIVAHQDRSPIGNAVASVLASAWFVTVGVGVLDQYMPNGEAWLGAFTFAVAALAGACAAQFGPGIDGLRRKPSSALEKLAVALWAQCGALIAVAIALQFDGYGQSVSWLVVALASVEIGRRLPSRGVSHFGLVVGSLALLRVALLDWQSATLQQTLIEIGPLAVTKYGLLVLLTIGVTQTAALRVARAGDERPTVLGTIICVIGTAFWAALCAIIAQDIHITMGWLIGAALLFGFERIGRRQHYVAIGSMLLVLAAGKWVVVDALVERVSGLWQATAHWPAMNLQFATAIAIAALGWRSAHLHHRRARARSDDDSNHNRTPLTDFAQVWIGVAGLFLLMAMCFEVDRAVGWFVSQRTTVIWYPLVLRALWMALLGAAAGVGWHWLAQRAGWTRLRLLAAVVAMAGAITWLSAGTIVPRLEQGVMPTTVIFNIQFMIGAAIILAMALLARRAADESSVPSANELTRMAATGLAGLIGLWMGSLEIDRALAGDPSVTQAALSVYWALYGVATVVVGFLKQSAIARWAGLVLVGVTVAKVLIIDMAGVDPLYRVISTVIVGLLLIAVSVGYAKITPKLIGE